MNESQKTKTALETFRKPYSCAQTIYAAFAKNADAATLESMKDMSGGRAPNNMCGALFAAESLLLADKKEDIEKIFFAATGSTKCSEIKKIHKIPCEVCVRTASSILESFIRD